MEKERKAMITCVQAIIKLTPFYDPLARPPGFYTGNSTADKDIVGGVTRPTPSTSTSPGLTPGPTPTTKPTIQPKKAARRRRQPGKESIESEGQTTSTKPPILTTTTSPVADVSSPVTLTPEQIKSASETTIATGHHHSGPKKSKKKKNKKTAAPTIITIGTTAQTETKETQRIVKEATEELTTNNAITSPSLASDIPPDVTEIIIGDPTEGSTISAIDNPSDVTEKTKGKGKKGKGKRHSSNHHKKEKKPKERKNLKENVAKLSDVPPPINTENEGGTGGE